MKPAVPLLLLVFGLAAGAPAARADVNGDLVIAAYKGDRVAVRRLLAKGGSPMARDANGYTPLHWAAYTGDTRLATLLLDAGAPVDAIDGKGDTPLMLAAWRGHLASVRLLLGHGANKAIATPGGFRAADFAKAARHYDVLRELVALAVVRHPGPEGVAPSWRPVATPRPRATPVPAETEPPVEVEPSPEPSHAPEEPQADTGAHYGNLLTILGGVHLSKIDFPIYGVHYRRTIIEPVAIQVGYELGGYNQALGAGSLDYNYSRLHAGLVTTGWLYGGLGVTRIVLGSLYAAGYNPAATSYEAIGGLNVPLGTRFNLNVEGRFGYGGPSTAVGGLGVLF